MSPLRARAEEYLAMRRALGFKLTTQGRHLMSFVRFCEERCVVRVTADLAIEWATQTSRGSGDEVYQARRLDVVRIFARHLQALDPATEVPPADVLSRRYRRIPPYLYSPQEVAALMGAAGTLAPALRAATWRTLIGLLAVTGMRQGEACRLERDNVDLQAGTLVIADSKFGKSRLVFLHPTAAAALRAYERARDRLFPEPMGGTFLINSRGGPLDGHNIQHTFAALIAAAGIQAPPGRRPPRLHDLRHSFTVATMLDWYRDGGNVQARLPLLFTWLGHVDPKSTYWYLQAVPELLALAAGRLQQQADGRAVR
ncbi:tyrosine-type recombinase/integrase [Nonomuraea sp. NPDC049400]|uniref:tyrosine-type recombinase/integrase n=1 Tax=Nonomuraea sp. NPDC049400 TaxID=3364352 RepID=UPI003794A581